MTTSEDPVIERIATAFPALGAVTNAVLTRWPEHLPYLRRSLGAHADDVLAEIDRASAQILRLIGDETATFVDHYRWMCDVFNRETLHFLRTGAYRCATFAEADANVYSNRPFMEKYMNGLLVSQALWSNHAAALVGYTRTFMPMIADGADYLEIGPGHGLFLARAAENARIASVTAWDVSAESLRQTGEALSRLGVRRTVELQQRDVMRGGGARQYHAIVISEVLEHLERPADALRALVTHLRPGGRIFVNVPINSPAPDHIFLLRTPDEAAALVRSAGLEILTQANEPMSGYTLAEAQAARGTVSCLFVAQPARA